jgi:hypothetical protein
MDEIPLPLRPALKSPYPTDEDVVRRIREAVGRRPAWVPGRNGDAAEDQRIQAAVLRSSMATASKIARENPF